MILWVLGGLVVTLAASLVWWNLRRTRTARIAASIPQAVRNRTLAAIDEAGVQDGRRVLMLRVIEGARTPAGHLARVRLNSPPLSSAWTDRTVVLLRDETEGIAVRPAVLGEGQDQAPTVTADGTAGPATLWLPQPGIADAQKGGDFLPSPYDPTFLCRRVPALREILEGLGDKHERLLPYIMVPGIPTHEIDTFLVSLMGGAPELIQGAHGATCSRCTQPMEFLFQVGDFLDLGGDAPVVYVYGCAEHPTELIARVDMH